MRNPSIRSVPIRRNTTPGNLLVRLLRSIRPQWLVAGLGCLLLASCEPPGDPEDPVIEGGDVRAIATQADGKVVIGGNFTSIRGTPRHSLARFETDGTLDATFDPDVDGTVFGVVIQDDGKIIIGGYFTSVGGVFRLHLARINPDGSLDPTYDPHPENPVYCMAPQPDGKLIIGGAFSSVGGASRSHVARLEESGLADPTFVTEALDNYVTGLLVQPDGAILVGGYFHAIGSNTRNLLARVSATGVLDAAFNPDVTGSQVGAMFLDHYGQIGISGAFSAVGGTARSGFALISDAGIVNPGIDPSPNGVVDSIAYPLDGRIILAGDFTTLYSPGDGTVTRLRTARVNIYGSRKVEADFNEDADGRVLGIAIQAEGRTLQGGEFTSINGAPRHLYARSAPAANSQRLGNTSRTRVQWTRDGEGPECSYVRFDLSTEGGATYSPLGFGSRISGAPPYSGWELTGLSLPRNGLIRALGRTIGGYCNGSAGWVQCVSEITPWTEDANPGVVGASVNVAVEQPDGKTIIAGQFTSVQGVPRRNAARLNADGTLDMTFDPSPNATVRCAAVQEDGRILLGGDFDMVQPNGAASPVVMGHLVRLDPDGSIDWSFIAGGFPPGPLAEVNCIVLQPDGKILLGGAFGWISGEVRSRLARLNPDGTADSFDPGVTGDGFVGVTSMVWQPDGKIVFAGYFDAVGGTPCRGIARVDADGVLDPSFSSIYKDGTFQCLALQSNGEIVAGGAFNAGPGVPVNLVRLHADGTLNNPSIARPYSPVWSVAIQADGAMLVGGQFTLVYDPMFWLHAHDRITRLDKDGNVDTWFRLPADAPVTCVALNHDGKLWLGGNFSTVDGLPRNALAQVTNPRATSQLTKTSASRIEWLRGGTAPEASYVKFDLSTDGGTTYAPLGMGTRIAGGWELTGLSLPSSGRIRARARVPGSGGGGSGGLVESVSEIGPPVALPTMSDRYASWSAAALPGRPAEDLAFAADPDHDGLANGVEFYLGLNPSVRSTLPLAPVRGSSGLTFTVTRAVGLGAMDATAVQWSTDLATWRRDGVTATVLGSAGPDHEQVRIFVPATGDRIFLRLALDP